MREYQQVINALVEKAILATRTPTPTSTSTPATTPSGPVGGAVSGNTTTVYISFYSCPPYCGDPSGPLPLADGQAACDWAYMGRRFLLNGQEWICNDTGGMVQGAHMDLFFSSESEGWSYLSQYGTQGLLMWLD